MKAYVPDYVCTVSGTRMPSHALRSLSGSFKFCGIYCYATKTNHHSSSKMADLKEINFDIKQNIWQYNSFLVSKYNRRNFCTLRAAINLLVWESI